MNNQELANPEAEKWQDLAGESEGLKIGDGVYSGYKIASLPYENKSEAYDAIRESWQGVPDVTTYFQDGSWYIITK